MAVDSIERIRQRARSQIMFSHFGPVREVDELCTLAAERLQKWASIVRGALARTDDVDEIAGVLERGTASEFEEAGVASELDRYELLSSMRMNAAGLVRYWRKRDEREGGATGRDPQAPGR
jgi:hypothetical protein